MPLLQVGNNLFTRYVIPPMPFLVLEWSTGPFLGRLTFELGSPDMGVDDV